MTDTPMQSDNTPWDIHLFITISNDSIERCTLGNTNIKGPQTSLISTKEGGEMESCIKISPRSI